MNLICALVFIFCISLTSCKSINYIDIDTNEDIFDGQSPLSEADNQKIFSNKLRFLKILPLNKGWKNAIDGHTLEFDAESKNSVPFAIIVTTPDSDLDQLKKSKSIPSIPVESEELTTVGGEPKDVLNIQVEEDKSDHESHHIHDNDNKSGITSKNIEEKIGEVLLPINKKSNAGEDDPSRINNELILKEPHIEDGLKFENQLQNLMVQNNGSEMRGFITDISKAKLEFEEALHDKEETQRKNPLLEVKNDPKDETVINPVYCTASKESGSCNERKVNEDDLKSFPITFVLNKYVFVK